MSKERFEIFGKIIKDNEEVPNLLDNYLATVRLNELNDKVKELEQELAKLKEKDNYHLRYELAGADETITNLKQQLKEKDKELLEFKKNKLYFELLITRLQWLHKRADEYKEEKERFGIDEEISLSSVWDVLSLQKNNICEYEEMCELQEGIECISNSQLLKEIEHDLQIKATRKEDEIFKDIELIDNQINKLKGE